MTHFRPNHCSALITVMLHQALCILVVQAAEPPLLDEARRALAESLPQLTISKLRRNLADPRLDAAGKAEGTRLLAEAYLATGQADEARTILAPLVANGDLQARILRAHALAKSGAWEEARDAYTDLCTLPDAPPAARIGAAESFHALGDTAKAVSLLEPVVQSGNAPASLHLRLASWYVDSGQLAQSRRILAAVHPTSPGDKLWERYVQGRILLNEHQPDAAGAEFNEVLSSSTDITENLAAAANLGMAEVKLAKQGLDAADKILETYIWNNPESPWIEMAFRRLDQVYAAERKPEEDQLQKWASHSRVARAALARFFLAKLQYRAAKWDRAINTLDTFIARYPTHRFLVYAHLLRSDALTQKGRYADAISALEAASRAASSLSLRAEIDLRMGLAQLRKHEFLLAATSLDRAAENSESLREIATYNAALAWLGQGNMDHFRDEYRRLNQWEADPELRGNLALEEALTRARTGNVDAETALDRFAEQFPRHPRIGEARIAIAELKLAQNEFDNAGRLLRIAVSKSPGKVVDDQAACLAIFLADAKSPRDDAETERLAKEFLRERPKSPLVADVRMKLGQIFFRQANYAGAQEQFVAFAREYPESASAETALFLAGQSAMRAISPGSTERALTYFDEVVKRNGPLYFHAREQQAIIQVRLAKEQEAVALYDLIIESRQPIPDPEIRNAALVGKGEALALLSRNDPQQVPAALAVYDQLSTSTDAGPSWRHQALYRKARLIADQPGRKADAIAIYNDILDLNLAASEKEFFWFYKAGFEAGRLFEQQQQWSAAIAIYEKMARMEGPHASEAKERAKQMRVDHFVWD